MERPDSGAYHTHLQISLTFTVLRIFALFDCLPSHVPITSRDIEGCDAGEGNDDPDEVFERRKMHREKGQSLHSTARREEVHERDEEGRHRLEVATKCHRAQRRKEGDGVGGERHAVVPLARDWARTGENQA